MSIGFRGLPNTFQKAPSNNEDRFSWKWQLPAETYANRKNLADFQLFITA